MRAALVLLAVLFTVGSASADHAQVYGAPKPGAITHVRDKNGFSCAWYQVKDPAAMNDVRAAKEGLPVDDESAGPILKKQLAAGKLIRRECDARHYAIPVSKKTHPPQ